jgi:hypothetical protein
MLDKSYPGLSSGVKKTVVFVLGSRLHILIYVLVD